MKKFYFFIAVICIGLRPGLIASQYSYNYEDEKTVPIVIKNVRNNLESITDGEIVTVKIGNYKPVRDEVLRYFEYAGHRIVGLEEGESSLTFQIQKGSTNYSGRSLAVLINHSDEKGMHQSLEAAWMAALSGMNVTIYVDGPAVKYLYTATQTSESEQKFLHKTNLNDRIKLIEGMSLDEKICRLNGIGVSVYADAKAMAQQKQSTKNGLCEYVKIDPMINYFSIIEQSEYQFIYDQVFQISKRNL